MIRGDYEKSAEEQGLVAEDFKRVNTRILKFYVTQRKDRANTVAAWEPSVLNVEYTIVLA